MLARLRKLSSLLVATGSQLACWCGNADLAAFGPEYSLCPACRGLVSKNAQGARVTRVSDDGRDFYGRDYWFRHQTEDLSYPALPERAQLDLPERCTYWLRTVLKYQMPPASILEIGCAHGGFVALLRCAGFDAVGLELSPWVAKYAHKTFRVPVLTGPLEDQRLEGSSLDIVVLMDVLEHLPDPIGTLKEAVRALRPDGLIVLQTPEFPEDIGYEELLARDHPFRLQLKPAEHLFSFSRRSIRLFCDRIGLSNLRFEVPIFAHYDMYLVASREPLRERDPAETVASLSSTPKGRLALALLDARKVIEKLGSDYGRCESDREARLGVIREQGQRIDWLEGQRNSVESEAAELRRNLLEAQSEIEARRRIIDAQESRLARLELDAKRVATELNEVRARCEVVEAEHAESLDTAQRQRQQVVELETGFAAQTNRAVELEGRLAAAEADRTARLGVIHDQGRRLGELDGERNTLRHELAAVTERLRASETDRADRLRLIEAGEARLARLEIDAKRLASELDEVRTRCEVVEAKHAESLDTVQQKQQQVAELETRLAAQTKRAVGLEGRLTAAEADRAARLIVIHDQARRLGVLDGERNTLKLELAAVTDLLRDSETDRADRLRVIEAQGRQMVELAGERDGLGSELAAITEKLRASEADCANRLELIETERRRLAELEAERLRQDQQLAATENRLSALRDQHSSQTEQLQRSRDRNSYLESHWLTRLGIQLRVLRRRHR